MLALSVLVPSGLLIPTVPQMAPSLPTTTVIAKGSFVPGVGKNAQGEVFAGEISTLNLESLLDTVEVDVKGEEGIQADNAGKQRIAAQEEKKLTPAEAQKAKQEAFKKKQQEDASKPFFPELPKISITF
jgi:hypothetical protein